MCLGKATLPIIFDAKQKHPLTLGINAPMRRELELSLNTVIQVNHLL
jgi:hypothetical protein